uniref:Transmembrane protein n=1 Tax=Triticum urartu TaxID=4572 RepID=A0A8R7QNA4_TRIUA
MSRVLCIHVDPTDGYLLVCVLISVLVSYPSCSSIKKASNGWSVFWYFPTVPFVATMVMCHVVVV